ncbi:MAG: M3 family oligoendopeptidase, partial [Deltaproteobacteria bacterium]|nr:M3 family oligoendopeptidase [Deltaproteobacteria bacterium]
MSGETLSRVADIKRPSEEFPRKYVPLDVDFMVWDNIEPLYIELTERVIESVESLEKWIYDMSEFYSVLSEDGSRCSIAMTCNTEDKDAEEAYLHIITEIQPKCKPFDFQLQKKIIDNPFTAELNEDRYGLMLRSTRNQVELFREENVDLETEIDKLSQQYQKLMGAMTVEFRGEEKTMQQMGVFFEENDRELRKEVFELLSKRRLQDADKMEELFNEMLKLRVQVAKNAGFENYRDYMFREYERFDYTPDDCEKFHSAVEKIVVPLMRRRMEERRVALGIDTVRTYDTSCDKYGRAPQKPFKDTQELIHGCQKIFNKVDPELGGFFQTLIDLGLLDLDSRKGKAPGGYQTSLHEVRHPFIFMNAVGLNRDLFTLLHEGGHSFHSTLARNEPLMSLRHAPMEFCEVASMAMEHVSLPHFDEFYEDAEAARAINDHFNGDIFLLAWVATIDAFQHWIYTNPDHTNEERAAKWLELDKRFG